MTPENETVHDEACPLLPHSHAESQTVSQASPTPLPVGQLAALCTVRLVDPIAFTQLFPYVNDFMSDLHLTDDPSRIGFYSGLVESTFALSQLCSIYLWAKLSDIIGRKPVILAGTLGTATTTLAFGLSKSLTGILFARCVGGLFSGNIAVIHSVVGEITDSTNQAMAIPIYALMWPIGSVVGPLIGGTFSHAASKYPNLLGYAVFEKYPYFFPCLVSAIIAFVGVLLGFVFLEETLPSKRRRNNEKCTSLRPNVPFPLSFVATSFEVVFVLFCYSAIQSGGLAFSASKIGWSLSISGGISSALQIFFMPYLLRTFDCAKMYLFSMSVWPFAYLCFPFLNLIARWGLTEDGQLDANTAAILWVGIAIALGLSRIGVLAFSTSMILVREHAPNPGALSQSNGIVQFAMCFARSFAPFLVSSLFALSIDNDLLWGYLWVAVMICLSTLISIDCRRILLHGKKTIS
ncbi:major facilitator superfamily domain-containing protein [Pisolithus tinctorius]|nr:major facilitator superfamily domain-containing protein [Pisolithus tinctorius]